MKIRNITAPARVYNNCQSKYYTDNSIKYDTFEQSKPKYNAVHFTGINGKGIVKQRGLLMHITSLPAHRSYCGQFGDPQTEKFIDWMSKSKQTHWIMNPLNALEDNLCPYSATGRFSRNKFIVNLNKLTGKEYGRILKPRELPDDITVPQFTLDMLEGQKNPRFKIAFKRFQKLDEAEPIKQEYNNFINDLKAIKQKEKEKQLNKLHFNKKSKSKLDNINYLLYGTNNRKQKKQKITN